MAEVTGHREGRVVPPPGTSQETPRPRNLGMAEVIRIRRPLPKLESAIHRTNIVRQPLKGGVRGSLK